MFSKCMNSPCQSKMTTAGRRLRTPAMMVTTTIQATTQGLASCSPGRRSTGWLETQTRPVTRFLGCRSTVAALDGHRQEIVGHFRLWAGDRRYSSMHPLPRHHVTSRTQSCSAAIPVPPAANKELTMVAVVPAQLAPSGAHASNKEAAGT
jgi:hypothetical protein